MSAWWLLPLALAACLAVLAIAACLSPKPRHAAPRRHLAAVPEPVAPAVGSMILAEERALHHEPTAAEVAASRAAHGYIPELDSDVQPDPYLDPIAAEVWEAEVRTEAGLPLDSGLGGLSSLTPGPEWGGVPESTRQLDGGPTVSGPEGATGVNAPPVQPTRLADTADVMDARLLAEVEAMMRAQDDDAALYLSRLRSACARARLDLQAALA